jgi:hypothetical protein
VCVYINICVPCNTDTVYILIREWTFKFIQNLSTIAMFVL